MNTPSDSAPHSTAPALPEASDLRASVKQLPAMSRREIWLELCVVLAVGVVPYFIYGMVSLAMEARQFTVYWTDAVQLLVSAGTIATVVRYLIHRSGETKAKFGLRPLRTLDWIIGAAVAALVAGCAIGLGYVLLWLGLTGDGFQFASAGSGLDLWLLVPMLFVNSLAEELVTRAYLITRLEQLTSSPWKALALSTALFASYHCYQGVAGMTGCAMIGLVFGAVFVYLRRLWPLVIAHTIYNLGLYLWAMQV